MSKVTVFVAMSGGVDSSVAAALLVESGFNVIGVTFKLWGKGNGRTCCSLDAAMDAKRVAHQLGIPHYVWNFEAEFLRHVVEPFSREYASGRTPNPCILCNRFIKFDLFFKRAMALGADYIATGHYARVVFDDASGCFKLLRALDRRKDQSYALYMLTQDVLSKLLLPLGEMTKDEVRKLAMTLKLQTASKPESQDICFVADGRYADVVIERYPEAGVPGSLIYADGRLIGRHRGIAHYTVGQRRGVSVRSPSGKPLYVVAIDADENAIIVGEREWLEVIEAEAVDVNIISGKVPIEPFACTVMHRYRSREVTAKVAISHSKGGLKALIMWDEPQIGVAPGQAVVFYSGDELLGGGTISSVRYRHKFGV
ncbi:MAG: tRNA 2-thiouridine(34) synthase MnmA [Armatimonadota bacterium]|nr:tRNA 2-thiouridine(34) synthase MnmA [Armatimonadota bacterium]MCX7777604.1 tRNA 2-thiouridine(34) synthase MnmA [Armatimonadota bacterium]MDW8024718.1 tRNA 2-thiouridine(34) synthase MnmA [Armatimonadota bacterium]